MTHIYKTFCHWCKSRKLRGFQICAFKDNMLKTQLCCKCTAHTNTKAWASSWLLPSKTIWCQSKPNWISLTRIPIPTLPMITLKVPSSMILKSWLPWGVQVQQRFGLEMVVVHFVLLPCHDFHCIIFSPTCHYHLCAPYSLVLAYVEVHFYATIGP